MTIEYGSARILSADGTPLVPLPADGAPLPAVLNPLDSEDSRKLLAQLESWHLEMIDQHSQNRAEMLTDYQFYDHEQWDAESIAILAERHQAASTYNLIHPVIDWIVGTERRTRVDWGVYPRNSEAQDSAEAKQKLLKFVSDANGITFARSKQFKQKVIGGVGWVREFAQQETKDGIPVGFKWIDWRRVRWDGYSREDDLSDCRMLEIESYVDLDYSMAMFPGRLEQLRGAASKYIEPGLELLQDDSTLPQVFYGTQSPLMRRYNLGTLGMSGSMSINRRGRPRVRLIETEFRRPIVNRFIKVLVSGYDECDGIAYDPSDADIADLLKSNKVALDDRLSDNIWLATWRPGFLCSLQQSPYRHNKFSLTPDWAYRRESDGMPYGTVRGLRDPQEEYNKRRSKALFAASVNRMIYEEDAIEADREEDVLEQASKPDGQIRLKSGGLAKFKLETNIDIGVAHQQLMALAKDDIYNVSSVTPDNLGQSSNAISGRAILAKQQQGAVGTAELFDNYRQSIQWSGQKTLSLLEQYLTKPMQVRVLGQKEGAEWLSLNQPIVDPLTGQVVFHNDITADEADFVVDEQDFRETVRMALAEMLMDTISKMPPEVGMQLLDLAVELTDIPNKAKIVQRIREINGQDKKDAPLTPEEQQAQAAAQQQSQEDRQLQVDTAQSVINKNNADAAKNTAAAHGTSVATKGTAFSIAQEVAKKPVFAPAADRLATPPLPPGRLSESEPPFLGTPPGPGVVPLPNPPAPAPAPAAI